MERWNIFARELEGILANRGLGLGHLDDRASVYKEKARRLRQSLVRPKSFPVLNTDEMDEVIKTFKLSDDEIMSLRAALLTTAIERMLMDRIDRDDALLAAEQIFPTILKAMKKYSKTSNGLGAVKGEDPEILEGTPIDLELEAALDIIDRATLALHLSYNVTLHTERIGRAQQALAIFEAALAELDELEGDVKATDAWHKWYDEAQKGLNATNKRLEELGA